MTETAETTHEAEARFAQEVQANLKRNYLAVYVQGTLGLSGFRMTNAPTLLPAYLHSISGSDAFVGATLALQQIGGVLSPIFWAGRMETRKRVMPIANLLGFLAHSQLLWLALAAFFLRGNTLIFMVVVFLFLNGLFQGPVQVATQVVLGKVIPVSMRGRLQGVRNMTGGLIAAGLSYCAGVYFVGHDWLGNGYATTFLFAFILTIIGVTFLGVVVREPDMPVVHPPKPMLERVKEFPGLLAEDPGFKNFLIAQLFATAGRVAAPFFILYASHSIVIDGKSIGLLSLAFLGADTVANLVWGTLGDRFGFRIVMRIGVVLAIAATGLLLVANSFLLIFLAFCGMGAGLCAATVGTGTMVLEFGPRHDMPMRSAMMSTAQGLVATAGPLLGGLVASRFGYLPLFASTITLQLAALYMYWKRVPEPRERRLTRERAAAEAATILSKKP